MIEGGTHQRNVSSKIGLLKIVWKAKISSQYPDARVVAQQVLSFCDANPQKSCIRTSFCSLKEKDNKQPVHTKILGFWGVFLGGGSQKLFAFWRFCSFVWIDELSTSNSPVCGGRRLVEATYSDSNSATVHLYCAVEKRQMSANCRTVGRQRKNITIEKQHRWTTAHIKPCQYLFCLRRHTNLRGHEHEETETRHKTICWNYLLQQSKLQPLSYVLT